jgi:hypothetical protein
MRGISSHQPGWHITSELLRRSLHQPALVFGKPDRHPQPPPDRLSAEQTVKYTPLLSPLDEVLIRSTFGKRDDSIHYNWNSLWLMPPETKSQVALQKAQAYKIDVDAAQIPAEALGRARENQLIEDGTYPGLESAWS